MEDSKMELDMNQTQEGYEGGVITDIFPSEVWKIILTRLNKSKLDLLRCRLVCYGLKELADEVLHRFTSVWKPTFAEDFEDFQKEIVGTRFATADQVNSFLADMENYEGNPFPTRTVIFAPSELDRQQIPSYTQEFYDSFNKLVDRYGDEISTLVYHFHFGDQDPTFVRKLQKIFELKNLQNLVIYRRGWSFRITPTDVSRITLEKIASGELKAPPKLTQLQILGEKGLAPLIFSIGRIPSLMDNLTHLQYSSSWYCEQYLNKKDANLVNLQTPKLKHLKICDPIPQLFQFYCQPQTKPGENKEFITPLKEISVKFPAENQLPPGFQVGPKIAEILKYLDNCHAETLELLHFDILKRNNPNQNVSKSINNAVLYGNMKRLILQLKTAVTWNSLVEGFVAKFNKIEELVIVVRLDDYPEEEQNIDERSCYELVSGLWNRFPPSLNVIEVPYFGWYLRRGQSISFLSDNK